MHFRWLSLVLLTVLLQGCDDVATQHPKTVESQPKQDELSIVDEPPAGEDIEFDGRSWTPEGTCDGPPAIVRLSMARRCYSSTDSTERLVELVAKEGGGEAVYSRILSLQLWNGSSWERHGLEKFWLMDGSYGETSWKNDVQHGRQREWYQDGQLKLERGWQDGKLHGPFKQFESDGTVFIDAVYSYGVAVE